MECEKCKLEKLRSEFPTTTDLPGCEHPFLVCLQCLHTRERCRQCRRSFSASERAVLAAAYHKCDLVFDENLQLGTDMAPRGRAHTQAFSSLLVVGMDGKETEVAAEPTLSVADFKARIRTRLGKETGLQRLFYEGTNMKVYGEGNTLHVLGDFVRGESRRVTLVVLLFSVTSESDLENITFDLHWGYPAGRGRDYLDAACFVFDTANAYRDLVFYAKNVCDVAVARPDVLCHSGDLMDDARRTGHHYIRVNLRQLSPAISTLYLTLSAYNSPFVGNYPNIAITLRDARRPTEELAPPWQPTIAARSQSVIMCALVREGEGGWGVVAVGEAAPGNAHDLFATLIPVLERRPRLFLA
eukprot:m.238770 g.238770  ORF g.238770 m.238770 type:complete len:356 (+) comp22020_c0_seq1:86-1153(+)